MWGKESLQKSLNSNNCTHLLQAVVAAAPVSARPAAGGTKTVLMAAVAAACSLITRRAQSVRKMTLHPSRSDVCRKTSQVGTSVAVLGPLLVAAHTTLGLLNLLHFSAIESLLSVALSINRHGVQKGSHTRCISIAFDPIVSRCQAQPNWYAVSEVSKAVR